jgi:hypothetical protein
VRVEITVVSLLSHLLVSKSQCVWKLHFSGINHTRACENRTLRVEINLGRVEITLVPIGITLVRVEITLVRAGITLLPDEITLRVESFYITYKSLGFFRLFQVFSGFFSVFLRI